MFDEITTDDLTTTDRMDYAIVRSVSPETDVIYYNINYPFVFAVIFGAVLCALAVYKVLFGGRR